jgi:DNA-binding GntR family transcriptional regulator
MAKQNVLSALVNDGPIIASEHRSLSAETAEKLRELILLEKLPPGMHIPERDLAEALGIRELACTSATDGEITAIAELNQKMINCTDRFSAFRFFKTDMAFHSSIIAATRNQALIDTHQQYNAKLWRARFMSSKRKRGRAKTLQQHQDITTALIARNASGVAQAMRGHIETAIDNLSIKQIETQRSTPRDSDST